MKILQQLKLLKKHGYKVIVNNEYSITTPKIIMTCQYPFLNRIIYILQSYIKVSLMLYHLKLMLN